MSGKVQITLPDEVYNLLKRLHKTMNISKSAVISLALQEYAKKNLRK